MMVAKSLSSAVEAPLLRWACAARLPRGVAEAVKLYQEIGFPVLQKGKHDKKLVGYFQADTGTINQLLHLWKFDDDADRRGALGRCICEQGLHRRFRFKVPPAADDPGSEAASGCALGAACLIGLSAEKSKTMLK